MTAADVQDDTTHSLKARPDLERRLRELSTEDGRRDLAAKIAPALIAMDTRCRIAGLVAVSAALTKAIDAAEPYLMSAGHVDPVSQETHQG